MKLLALLSAFVVFTSADCQQSLLSFADLLSNPTDDKIKTRCTTPDEESFVLEIQGVAQECGADDKYLKIFLGLAEDTLCQTKSFFKNKKNNVKETHYCLVPLLGLFDFTGVLSAVGAADGGPSGAAVTEFFKTYDWSSYPPSHEAKVCSVPKCSNFLKRVIMNQVQILVDKDIVDEEAVEILDNVLDGLRNCGTRGCRKKWPEYWVDGKLVLEKACRPNGTLKPCAVRRMMFHSKTQVVDRDVCLPQATETAPLIDAAAEVVVKIPNFLWLYYEKLSDKPAIKKLIVEDALEAAFGSATDLDQETELLFPSQISLNIEKDSESKGLLITMTVTTTSADVDLGGLSYLGQWIEDNPGDTIVFNHMDRTDPTAFANGQSFFMHSATVVSVKSFTVDDGGKKTPVPDNSGAETDYACSSVLVAVLGCLALY